MAVTAKYYGLFYKSLFNKEIDLDSDTLKVMLCTNAYTPNQDTHQYKSQVSNEVAGAGYTAGGATLTGVAVVYDASSNVMSLDAADVSWPGVTITARYAVLYDASPASDATRPLIGFIDFGQDEVRTNGTMTLQWSAAGIAAVGIA